MLHALATFWPTDAALDWQGKLCRTHHARPWSSLGQKAIANTVQPVRFHLDSEQQLSAEPQVVDIRLNCSAMLSSETEAGRPVNAKSLKSAEWDLVERQ